MIVFFFGSDAYRLKQEKSELASRYKKKYPNSINLFYFNLADGDQLKFLSDSLKNASFFKEHKLIFCDNVFGSEAAVKLIADFVTGSDIKSSSETTLVVTEYLAEKDLAGRKDIFNLLTKEAGVLKEINFLNGPALLAWVEKEFNLRDCRVDRSAIKKLVEVVGNNSWALANEIEKLANYKNRGEVTVDDIDCLVFNTTSLNIFNLTDAMIGKNPSAAVQLLYKELKIGRDPYYIFTMIAYQVRNLIIVSDLKERGLSQKEIAAKSKLHPFIVQKIMAALAKFNRDKLVKIHDFLLSLDTGFKTGRLDLEDGLYGLLNL